jgi:threonine synthase
MVHSWKSGAERTRPEDIVPEPTGIAEAILRGNPTHTYPHLREVVAASGGTFESVTEAEIVEAQKMLRELEGIEACASSATTLAAIKKMAAASELRRDDVIFVNVTGGMRPETVTPREYVTLWKSQLLEGVDHVAPAIAAAMPQRPGEAAVAEGNRHRAARR